MDDDPNSPWLDELRSKLWNRKELEPALFRTVKVTKAHYDELERRLKEKHPDRYLPGYDGARHDVRSIKFDVLGLVFPDNNEDHVDDGDHLAASNEDGSETNSLFPFTLRFLDLSTLCLEVVPERLPSPLCIRGEYDFISALIGEGPQSKHGSVVVSGQPGTGEVLHWQLPPYLTASNQLADVKARPHICTLESFAL